MDTLTRLLWRTLKPIMFADDPGVGIADPPDAPPAEAPDAPPDAPPAAAPFSWKANLSQDFANSPTVKKYADTKDGLNDAVKAHLELQKLLGHQKVPIPKGPNDTAAMAMYKQAFQIPEKPEGYALPDAEIPASMPGLALDKSRFAAAIHQHNLTPAQAKGLWSIFVETAKGDYAASVKGYEDTVSASANQMRAEWGDAYESKVALGQMVINKFAENAAMNDFVTSVMVKDPRGIKFLASIGEQFAENKIGDFQYQRHSLTPEEIQRELSAIRANAEHPYNNEHAPRAERDAAISYVNSLYEALNRTRGHALSPMGR